MQKSETIQDFYTRNPSANPHGLPLANAGGLGHFNVFTRNGCLRPSPYNRRDFYKISLIIGTGRLYYADKWVDIDRTALLFSNPLIPYSWEAISQEQQGYFCLFTEAFIHSSDRAFFLQQSPLFKIGGDHLFFLDPPQEAAISVIFEKMTAEIGSAYVHKYELLRTYVHLLIHEALKMQPCAQFEQHVNASARITSLFMELLERQFPIDHQERILHLRTAADFARHLAVHVNHLNRAVKETTGKTTTEHISGRIVKEAQALLQHSDWNVAEIAYSLGFEYPAYFNNFFKKQTDRTPSSFRR